VPGHPGQLEDWPNVSQKSSPITSCHGIAQRLDLALLTAIVIAKAVFLPQGNVALVKACSRKDTYSIVLAQNCNTPLCVGVGIIEAATFGDSPTADTLVGTTAQLTAQNDNITILTYISQWI
jgi:hypothetical protein